MQMCLNNNHRHAYLRISTPLEEASSTVHLLLYRFGRAPVYYARLIIPVHWERNNMTRLSFGLAFWLHRNSRLFGAQKLNKTLLAFRTQIQLIVRVNSIIWTIAPTAHLLYAKIERRCSITTKCNQKGDWQSHVSGLSPRPVLVDLSTRWLQSSDGIWFLGVGYGQLHNRYSCAAPYAGITTLLATKKTVGQVPSCFCNESPPSSNSILYGNKHIIERQAKSQQIAEQSLLSCLQCLLPTKSSA